MSHGDHIHWEFKRLANTPYNPSMHTYNGKPMEEIAMKTVGYEEARKFVAEFVHTQLSIKTDQELEGTDYTILKAFPPEYRVGPYGGEQQVILGAIDNGAEVYPYLIAVYSDLKIQDKLTDHIEAMAARQSLRDKLRST